MSTLLPAAHPVASFRQLLLPSADPRSSDLLATPGLEHSFNARGSLLTAFEEIARTSTRRRVLLPAFHCPSGITPALMAGLEPVFYRIRRDLSIDLDDLFAKCDEETAAGLIIHFFGQEPDPESGALLRSRGIRVVEDCSHSFLRTDPLRLSGTAESDYRVFSFWKIVPSGVGGGLWRRDPSASGAAQLLKPTVKDALRAYKVQVEESIHYKGWESTRSLFESIEDVRVKLKPKQQNQAPASPGPSLECGEDHYPVSRRQATSQMPGFARRLLLASNLSEVAARRRANYVRYLAHRRELVPMQVLFPDLPSDSCPWVMPVLLNGRSEIDFRLRQAGVALHTFGIFLHSALFKSTDDASIEDARFLAERLLCLAIHQDLNPEDIDRSAGTISSTMKNLGLS